MIWNYKEQIKLARLLNRHIVFTGGTGTGKTTQAMTAANELVGEENVFSYRGHARSESIDFLGMYVRHGKGMEFNDGFLTQAFVKAKNKKVIVFIDELGRIPDAEKDLLIGSITPDADGFYNLDTGKGIKDKKRFSTETLRVPSSNLTVIGTTNLGSDFDVSLGDEAFGERFLVVTVNDNVYSTIFSIGTEEAFKEREDDLKALLDSFASEVDKGNLKRHMNFRLAKMWFTMITDSTIDNNLKALILAEYVTEKYVINQSKGVKDILLNMGNEVLGMPHKVVEPTTPEIGMIDDEMKTIVERMVKAKRKE